MASLTKWNNNTNFNLSNIKKIVIVCFIISYVTKKDCNKYQCKIYVTFVSNAYDQRMQ